MKQSTLKIIIAEMGTWGDWKVCLVVNRPKFLSFIGHCSCHHPTTVLVQGHKSGDITESAEA
jgi:hypothetical protein